MDFRFKKKYGQNFLTDKNLLKSIVRDGEVDQDVVIEIGPGSGALTEELAKVCKKVIAYEIDTELKEILDEKFKDYSKVKIFYEDFLKLNDELILKEAGDNFKVIANLPYYITTPILTKLLSLRVRPKKIVVMVQKEVGERIVASPKSSSYGYFSAFIKANGQAKITRQVNRKMFTPAPNVDSCVVVIEPNDQSLDSDFDKFLLACFSMKRKTLVNNLAKSYNLDKPSIEKVLRELDLDENIRADALDVRELEAIYNNLCKML